MSGRIVVLGMHRSGTSCVGELLAAMGAYLGPRGMGTTGTVDNPHGPFERRDLRRLCHLILKQARTDWWATSRFSADRAAGATSARESPTCWRRYSPISMHMSLGSSRSRGFASFCRC